MKKPLIAIFRRFGQVNDRLMPCPHSASIEIGVGASNAAEAGKRLYAGISDATNID
ncbi:hypothetical protein [Pseudomonas chlororaphis]|uniref:hypothetical protein n=1 Tax=Pseudomonas chlororaphis TaxID=587753 RepID=UPI0012DA99CB|nr:hypothetical protein [Pseudomonas chlororaphis]MBP5067955.1 hypothetical protein [Pseudomonas chlororaphis]UQS89646.1 hypothetical protein M5C90_30540 [Pseudomonas chlororaphis subsp. piscium]WDG71620.1 hypothetical protein PUP65_26525 [Pseudomonas chlororaphis]WDH30596.1 hypothetical protein PUP81_07795 [Pseudomonas chlororaphis]WDH70145.1 hypothetical protein PUP78_26510 [Pseudomonas chlororaphis]